MTKVWDEYIEKGKVIERKVIESEKEISVFNFKVNTPLKIKNRDGSLWTQEISARFATLPIKIVHAIHVIYVPCSLFVFCALL